MKVSILLLATIIVVGLILSAVLFKSTLQSPRFDSDNVSADVENNVEASTLYGFSLSPKSFNDIHFVNFFEQVSGPNSVISWAGDWKQLDATSGAPFTILNLSRTYNYTPVLIAHVATPDQKLDIPDKGKFIQTFANLTQQNSIKYLGIGIEINTMYRQRPEEFQKFVLIFQETVAVIKQISPGTQVFTIFQYETLQGLHGGLYGGVNDISKHNWQLLSLFESADFIGLTTYPGLIFKSPEEIPVNHYSQITTYSKKPIAIVETAWEREGTLPGWESSPAEQVDFLTRLFELTLPLKPKMIIYSFLYDVETSNPAFKSMGLIGEVEESPGWQAWRKLVSASQNFLNPVL